MAPGGQPGLQNPAPIDGKYVQQSLKTRNERIAQDRQREIDSDLHRHRDGIATMPRAWDDVMAGFMREKLPFIGDGVCGARFTLVELGTFGRLVGAGSSSIRRETGTPRAVAISARVPAPAEPIGLDRILFKACGDLPIFLASPDFVIPEFFRIASTLDFNTAVSLRLA